MNAKGNVKSLKSIYFTRGELRFLPFSSTQIGSSGFFEILPSSIELMSVEEKSVKQKHWPTRKAG